MLDWADSEPGIWAWEPSPPALPPHTPGRALQLALANSPTAAARKGRASSPAFTAPEHTHWHPCHRSQLCCAPQARSRACSLPPPPQCYSHQVGGGPALPPHVLGVWGNLSLANSSTSRKSKQPVFLTTKLSISSLCKFLELVFSAT